MWLDVRWDASSCQHFGLHGVESFALTDAQLDLYSVMAVVLEEEAIVDDELGIGSCAIEDVDLQEEQKNCEEQETIDSSSIYTSIYLLQGHTELKSDTSNNLMESALGCHF